MIDMMNESRVIQHWRWISPISCASRACIREGWDEGRLPHEPEDRDRDRDRVVHIIIMSIIDGSRAVRGHTQRIYHSLHHLTFKHQRLSLSRRISNVEGLMDSIDWIDSAPSDTRSLHTGTNERTNDCGAVGVGVGIGGSHR